jgi:UDP-glucose 4-epimerase
MSEKVLITGASGFLGYHIVKAAIEQGLDVYGAIRKNSDIEHLRGLPIQYLYLDYNDVDGLTTQLRENKIVYIIHAAGITKALKEETYNLINATYTLNLAQAAKNSGAGFKKFVFISSLAAIGPLANEEEEITEATAPKPVTAYGRSKLLAEQYLAEVAIPTTTLRPTAVYGPRDRNIFILVKAVSRGFDPFMGNFSQRLSFVHARDVADVAVAALFKDSSIGAYNITDGKSYNRYQFSDIVKKILGRKALRFHIPMPMVRTLAYFLETTNGWMKKPSVLSREKLLELGARNWICNIQRAEKELGFHPKYDLQNGLEDSLTWYSENKWI